jgi:hypothetical protein
MHGDDHQECELPLGQAAMNNATQSTSGSERKVKKRPPWYERTSVTLCVAGVLVVAGFGFIHVIIGVNSPYELPVDVVLKDSFGYDETFVNAGRILQMPYRVATARYPLGCKVLQRRGYMNSGRRFETKMRSGLRGKIRRWESEFERAMGLGQGRWQDRLQERDDSVPVDPQSAAACNQRGIVLAREGRLEAALAEFASAIERAPALAEAFHNRALVYAAIGNLGQAAVDLGSVIDLRPDVAEGYVRRGRLHARMERHAEAVEDFTEAIEICPKQAEAYFRRAIAHYANGDYARSQKGANTLRNLGVAVPRGYLEALGTESEK